MVAAVGGGIEFARGGFIVPATAAVASVLFVYGWFRYGTVVLAFRALRRGNLKRAEKMLAEIRYPNRLGPQYLSFYWWIQGALAADAGDLATARRYLELAYNGRLRTAHNHCVVACCLADLALRLGEMEQARRYLRAARTHVHRSELDPMIEKLEREIAQGMSLDAKS
jgi:hypothetical protein